MFLKVTYFLKPTFPFDSEAIFANRSTKELKFEKWAFHENRFQYANIMEKARETVCGRPQRILRIFS